MISRKFYNLQNKLIVNIDAIQYIKQTCDNYYEIVLFDNAKIVINQKEYNEIYNDMAMNEIFVRID